MRSVDYRWSAQDNTTVDGLPFVGPLTPFEDRVLMATGFAKWGLTGGTAAALILADRILGRENPWASLFDPTRLNAARLRRQARERERQGRRALRRRPRHQARPPADSRTSRPARATSSATAARRSPATATRTAR